MKYITSKGLLYSTKDCIQYLLVTNNGKESEKEYIYMKLNHYAAYLKLTRRYYKSTILQLKQKSPALTLILWKLRKYTFKLSSP